jgi:hypothetical protein
MRTTKIKITTTKRVTNSCNKERKRKITINMRTMIRRATNNYKHKRCKTRIPRSKITMIRRITNSYNQEGASLKCLNFKRFSSKVVLIASRSLELPKEKMHAKFW